MNRLLVFFLPVLVALDLWGCAAELLELGPIEAEEGAMLARGLARAAVVEDAALVEEAAGASRMLSRYGFTEVRLVQRLGASYLEAEDGAFAEVVNSRTLRLRGYGRVTLPGRLYAVRDEVARVFVKPGSNYQVLTQVTRGRTFLVLRKLNGWLEISDGEISGFVAASAMISVLDKSFSHQATVTSGEAILHKKQSNESPIVCSLPYHETVTVLLSWKPLNSDIAVTVAPTTVIDPSGRKIDLAIGENVYIVAHKRRQLIVSYSQAGKEKTGILDERHVKPVRAEKWCRVRSARGEEGWVLANNLSFPRR